MAKSRKSFPLRIDPALYAELEAWAQQEFRSVNGQIEFLLRDAVARRRRSSLPDANSKAGGENASPASPADEKS
jgi:hypothetical protein